MKPTKANSAERAHQVENFVDSDASYHGLTFEDQKPDTLKQLEQRAKSCHFDDLLEVLMCDIRPYLEKLANE